MNLPRRGALLMYRVENGDGRVCDVCAGTVTTMAWRIRCCSGVSCIGCVDKVKCPLCQHVFGTQLPSGPNQMEDKCCMICLLPSINRTTTCCRQIVHDECRNTWVTMQRHDTDVGTCPNCRAPMDKFKAADWELCFISVFICLWAAQ